MDAAFAVMPTKETAPCCIEARDALGRPPIGFCGPDCVRREARRLLAIYQERVISAWREWNGSPAWLDAYTERDHTWEPSASEWHDPTAVEALR